MAEPDKVTQWMYKGDKIDSEAFLLGKPVERADQLNTAKKKEDSPPPAAGQLSMAEIEAARAAVDMAAKLREDPLVAMRQQEEESRRQLLLNPVRLKQIRKLLGQDTSQRPPEKQPKEEKKSEDILKQYLSLMGDKERKKKQKKEKRQKKDDGSSSEDEELLAKYLNVLKGKEQAAEDLKQEIEDEKTDAQKKVAESRALPPGKDRGSRYKDQLPEREKKTGDHGALTLEELAAMESKRGGRGRGGGSTFRSGRGGGDTFRSQRPGESERSQRSGDFSRRRSRSPVTSRQYNSSRRSRSPQQSARRNRSPPAQGDQRSSQREHSPTSSSQRRRSPPRRPRLTDEEATDRLKQMLSNAASHEQDRRDMLAKHREDEAREEAEFQKGGKKMVAQAGSDSLSDTMRRNRHNKQKLRDETDCGLTGR